MFVRDSRGSSALERGLRILRAFLGSAGPLTNRELAARSGLPRSTVSRLTKSLVEEGFLEYETTQAAYQLAPVQVSLAATYRASHSSLVHASTLLQTAAVREKVNLSLAVADGLHSVYLESYRESTGPVQRVMPSGSRLPIESYVSGHALIAGMAPAVRAHLFARLEEKHGTGWRRIHASLLRSGRQHEEFGYCSLSSVQGLASIAAALRAPEGTLCAVVLTSEVGNPSMPALLMNTVQDILSAWR